RLTSMSGYMICSFSSSAIARMVSHCLISRLAPLLPLLLMLTVPFARSGSRTMLLPALLCVVTYRLLSARTLVSTRVLRLCTTLLLHATLPLPLLHLVASCYRTCSLTSPLLPQSLTSLRISALVTPATALRFCWCNPTVCIRLVVCVRTCVCAWNG
ncbi:unnamed protein product, partial [Closterium sp. NIES-53]